MPRRSGAIHFHDDDIDDARWAVDFEWEVPADVKSACYAAKLTTMGGDEDYIPFFVVPRLGTFTSKIAVMMPTISYMAYANEHLANNGGAAELLVYRVPIARHRICSIRISERLTFTGALRARGLFRDALGHATLILAQSHEDATRYAQFDLKAKIVVIGNTKLEVAKAGYDH